MAKKWLETLYDAAKVEDDDGLTKMDEQKLRRYLESNNKMFARNKSVFSDEEPKYHTCSLYNPCPICDKCLNKASHLYVRCQSCQIPICVHKYSDRSKMIKRFNFRSIVDDNTYNELFELSEEVLKNNNKER